MIEAARGLAEASPRAVRIAGRCLGQIALLLAEETAEAMHEADDRPFATEYAPAIPLDVDRPQAGFASWYEMFPRSATDDPERHGTFAT